MSTMTWPSGGTLSIRRTWFEPWPVCAECGRHQHRPGAARCHVCAEPAPIYEELRTVLGETTDQDVRFAEWVERERHQRAFTNEGTRDFPDYRAGCTCGWKAGGTGEYGLCVDIWRDHRSLATP